MESGIKYVKGNFILGELFESLDEMNERGWLWLNEVALTRVHGTTGEIVKERFEKERGKLFALRPNLTFDTAAYSLRRVSRDCLVSYGGCRYSVPHRYVSENCLVKDEENGFIQVLIDGRIAVIHALSQTRNKTVIVPDHYHGIKTRRAGRRRTLPLLNGENDFPQVVSRPLSIYEEMVGGLK